MPAAKPKEVRKIGPGADNITMLVVAETGWGKTRFAGTAPGLLVASCDPEGTSSVFFGGGSGDEMKIRDKADWDRFYAWLRDGGTSEYQWLCVDTITELQKILMKTRLSTRPVKGNQEKDVADRPDYQITQIQLIDIVKAVNDLPINVIWTSNILEIENNSGETQYFPMIHGGKGDMARQIRGYMRIVGAGQLLGDEEEDRTRRMHFVHTGPYLGKDRFDALGLYQDDLTVPKLERLIAKKRDEVLGKSTTTARKTTTAVKRRRTTAA